MANDLSRELRLAGIVGGILGIYGAAVAAMAAAHDQLALLLNVRLGGLIATIWMTAFVFVFCAYSLDLLLRRRPARPLQVMAAEMRAAVLRPDLLVARATIVFSFLWMMIFFTPAKILVGHARGFPYDAALARLDRLIFAGHDPWQLTHALFGSVPATALLQLSYNVWFAMVWLGVIYMVLRPQSVRLRARYLVGFLLSWIIVGSVGAYLLASAGPCYFERAFGDPQFRPLMDRLHAIDAELRTFSPTLGIQALKVQDMLWNSFVAKRELFGGGISAMPSMHVSMAVLMACAGWKLGRVAGSLLTGFAALIWIGSVHLGWHYALDGAVALGLTLAIWKVSGWLVDRVMLRNPAPGWRPALAE